MRVDSKARSSWVSASKKSAERRCASRWGSLVSTEAALTVPWAGAEERSSAIWSVTSNWLNSPRTVAIAHVLDGEADLGVGRINGPGAGGDGGGGTHGEIRFLGGGAAF